jgi:hypothetical protein
MVQMGTNPRTHTIRKWTGEGNDMWKRDYRVFLVGNRQRKCFGTDRQRTEHQTNWIATQIRCFSVLLTHPHIYPESMVNISQEMIPHALVC